MRDDRWTPMSESKEQTCFLCSKHIRHSPGKSMVEVTFQRERAQPVSHFHRHCFVAFTTGTRRAGDIWTYRIVSTASTTAIGRVPSAPASGIS